MAMAVERTEETSLGLSGTMIMLDSRAMEASSPTYFSAMFWTMAAWPPGAARASETALMSRGDRSKRGEG